MKLLCILEVYMNYQLYMFTNVRLLNPNSRVMYNLYFKTFKAIIVNHFPLNIWIPYVNCIAVLGMII